MDILGVGIPELIFILLIAMMVFGPRRLPEIASQMGQYVRKFRMMSQTVQAEWQQQIKGAAALKEEASRLLPPSTKDLTAEIKNQVADTMNIDNLLKPKVNPDKEKTPEMDKIDVIKEKTDE